METTVHHTPSHIALVTTAVESREFVLVTKSALISSLDCIFSCLAIVFESTGYLLSFLQM